MEFEITLESISEGTIAVGATKAMTAKYKITIDGHDIVKAKFVPQSGFTISGTAEFTHDLNHDQEFEKVITVVAGGLKGEFTLKLQGASSTHNNADTGFIQIVSIHTALPIDHQALTLKRLPRSSRESNKYRIYKLLRRRNFSYNRSTRNWGKQ